jgi:hypothetical protein
MPTPPLALTDAQLDIIHRIAWPLAPADRQPSLGDGTVYRVAVEQQRRFWSPPVVKGAAGVGKWAR